MKGLFLNLGIINKDILNLTPNEAYKNCLYNKAVLVDVRESYMNAYKQFDIPECIQYPITELLRSEIKLPTNKIMIFADASGIKSKEAVVLLKKRGYETIANMSGGIVEWERNNLPLLIDNSNRLSGSCMCQLKYRDNKNT